MKKKKKLLTGFLAASVILPVTGGEVFAATYHADSDTGVEALDYIENNHRAARVGLLTDEQKKLLSDAREMEKHLRQPLDKTKPMPIAFEGEDLTYDERTGDFIAKGNVDILQLDAHRFQGELITGNTKSQDIRIEEKAHVLQMTEGQAKITLNGYKANYNYGTKQGVMTEITGKMDEHYISAKRFEMYPDHMVAYDATETRCGAKNPDYQVKAKKIIIIPNERMEMQNVRFYIKGVRVLSRKRYVANIRPGSNDKMPLPRVGYNSDDKAYLKWKLSHAFDAHTDLNFNLFVTGEDGWRSNYDLTWHNAGIKTGVTYGHFEDSDDEWIKKEPSGFFNYNDHVGNTHVTYGLGAEYGRWYGNGVHSNHGEYGVSLGYDPIKFHRYTLNLGTGYSITRESFDDSRVSGMRADAVLTKDFNDRWAAYTGYHYSKKNEENSLFSFDTDNYSKKLEGGFSYRIDSHNRFVMGTKYDLDHSKWKNIDYYWYHDLHCSELIVRYKSMENHFAFRWQFTPW